MIQFKGIVSFLYTTIENLFILFSKLSLPYLIRFRQVVSEYLLTGGENYISLFNAGKYLGSIVLIVIGHVGRMYQCSTLRLE